MAEIYPSQGRALALRIGRLGARVLLLARTSERLEEVKSEIGDSAAVFPVDLRDSEAVEELGKELADRTPDIVIHNAGKSIKRSLHDSLDRAHDFERTIGVNYLGPVRLQLALLPAMMQKRGGQIINVSSVSVRLPPAEHWAAYHCSKSDFDLWIAAALPELRRDGSCCTCVQLGLVHTRMSAPTKSYANMAGQTAERAAASICRAIVYRPRAVQPWWLPPSRLLTFPLERVSEWAQGLVIR